MPRLREARPLVPGGPRARAPCLRRAPPPTHRHEPLVLIQALPVGRYEQAPILDPAGVQPRLLLQVAAHHAPGVGQQLHLHVAGPQLPQQAWRAGAGRPQSPAGRRPPEGQAAGPGLPLKAVGDAERGTSEKSQGRGARGAGSVKHPTSAQVTISGFMRSSPPLSPTLGSPDSKEPS